MKYTYSILGYLWTQKIVLGLGLGLEICPQPRPQRFGLGLIGFVLV